MRIGIVTFHHADNFGALLQAYSLQTFIQRLGHQVEIVDFVPKNESWSRWIVSVLGSLARTVSGRPNARLDSVGGRNFEEFRRSQLSLTQKCASRSMMRRVASTFDLVIVGSDQVWNSNLNSHSMKYYLLDDFGSATCRIGSYAACIGTRDQLPVLSKLMRSRLRKFSFVLVRNEFSKNFVDLLGCNNAAVVCDPTLLLDQRLSMQLPRVELNEFVLIYVLLPEHVELARHVALDVLGDRRLKFVWIQGRRRIDVGEADDVIRDASPEQWLALIERAKCVITDSFHGVVFSIKFGTPFIPVGDTAWRSERIEDLISRYGVLESRSVYLPESCECQGRVKADAERSAHLLSEGISGVEAGVL